MVLPSHFVDEMIAITWRTSLLIALVFALRPLLSRWLPLKVLPWFWLVVAIKLLFISAPAEWWSLYNLADLIHRFDAAPAQVNSLSSLDIDHVPLALASSTAPADSGGSYDGVLILAAWLLGVVVLVVVQSVACLRFYRRLSSETNSTAEWHGMLNECAATAGLRRAPLLIETDLVDSPAITGLFRPWLLVPRGLFVRLEREEVWLVFLHELVHLRRRDLWLLTFFAIVRTLHWFNPLVWLAERALRADTEAACDAEVLGLAPSLVERYGQTLLRLTRLISGRRGSVLTVAVSTNADQMERRLKMILRYRKSSRWMNAGGLVIVLLIGALTLPNEVHAQAAPVQAPVPVGESLPNRAKIMSKLKSIVLPKVNFNQAKVEDVLQFITQKSKELDPDHEGINFVLRLVSNKPGSPPTIDPHIHNQVTVALDNVPIEDLLNYITQQTNLQYTVEDYAVYLRPAVDDSEILTVRTFLVPPTMFKIPPTTPGNATPAETSDGKYKGVDVKGQLANLGFLFPAGATATYLPEKNKLVVRDTPKQLDLIVTLIAQLSAPNANHGASPPGN